MQHLIILSGKSRDTVCQTYNLPLPNRIYYSGNERETIRLNNGDKKYGLFIDDEEWYTVRFNIVNVGKKPLKVYLTEACARLMTATI